MSERIAVIGTGISGMATAYLLHPHYDVTVYEKNDRIGGHSRTLTIDYDGDALSVDTGFIVFNHRNYPHLTKLFDHLGVETIKSDMSFGVSLAQGKREYSGNLKGLFGQFSNIVKPSHWRMLKDITRFNKQASQLLQQEGGYNMTLAEYLDQLGMSQAFRQFYLLPMGGAIWSCPAEQMLAFPAKTFIQFFDNHGLLTINDQPQWYTVKGGSQSYVEKLTAPYKERITKACGASAIKRSDEGVMVTDSKGEQKAFDRIVLACHADEALALLEDADTKEQEVLSAFHYSQNEAVLHRDKNQMPKRSLCWASWVYFADQLETGNPTISLTYWMNNLQRYLPKNKPVFVTLNPTSPIPEEKLFNRYVFTHPIFNVEMVNAQPKLAALSGHRNCYYAGAHHRYGFHEDGLLSAVHIAEKLGVEIPWE